MKFRDILLSFIFILLFGFLLFLLPPLLLPVTFNSEAVAVSFVSAFGDILSSNFFVILIAITILFASISFLTNVIRFSGYSFAKNESDLPVEKVAAVDQKKIFDEEDCKK